MPMASILWLMTVLIVAYRRFLGTKLIALVLYARPDR